jgi:E3 ubiquitin-protein ligase BAH
MKFGHLYHDRLVQAGFPPYWIDSAISYNQLKKCIKRVRKELDSLGLDAITLQRLLDTVENRKNVAGSDPATCIGSSHEFDDGDRPLRYEFSETATEVGESIQAY